MPDGRHHDPHIEGKFICAGLCEEVALEKHAGPLAELNNRTGHAFRPEGEVRRSVEDYGVGALHGKLLVAGLDGKPLDLKNEPAAFQSV